MAKGADCKSAGGSLRRFESYLAHYFTQADTSFAAAPPQAGICQGVLIPGQFAHVAQPAERILGKNEVMGSSPIVGFVPRFHPGSGVLLRIVNDFQA